MDLQNVRNLAHRLYCACQEPSSPYLPLAKRVRALRNKLEEADEALSGTSFRPEDIRLLETAAESKSLLSRLDTVIQQNGGNALAGSEPDDTVADFIAHLAVVTHKLSEALRDLEQANGRSDLLMAEMRQGHQRYASASTSSWEPDKGVSRDTSFRSSTTSHSSYDHVASSPERPKMPAIAEQKASTPGSSYHEASPSVSEQTLKDSPRTPADPLVAAMDEASTMMLHSSMSSPSLVDRTSLTSMYLTPYDSGNGSPQARRLPEGGRDLLFRTNTDPSQTVLVEGLRPKGLRVGSPGPSQLAPQTVRSRASSATHHEQQSRQFSTASLPSRARYYIANPDAGLASPIELPGHEVRIVVDGEDHTLQPDLPQLPRRSVRRHQLHPALRGNPNVSGQPAASGIYDPSETREAEVRSERQEVSHMRPSSRNSDSSEALTPDMRSTSKFVPGAPSPALIQQEPIGNVVLGQDAEQVDHIGQQWNSSNWAEAEMRIRRCLADATNKHDLAMIRRMRHLLGVVASVLGQWQQALAHFISVFRTAVVNDLYLDDGDCAAAYWLGDTYCLLNRRAEALMAYLVAEHSSLFRGTQVRQRVLAEQNACLPVSPAASTDEWKSCWEREAKKVDRTSADSILNPQVLTGNAETLFLERARMRFEAKRDAKKQHVLDANHSRVMAFRVLGADAGSYDLDYRMRIGASAFDTAGPWPLMFDPFFAMANVLHGRMVRDEYDLLSLISLEPGYKLPKANRDLTTHFTAKDLRWLITTIRECLIASNMVVAETAKMGESFRFIARFPASVSERLGKNGIATTHFLTINLFRQSLNRSGYSVDVASEGLNSARIVRGDWLYDKGVPTEETQRVRGRVVEYLEAAAKRQERAGGAGVDAGRYQRKRGPFSMSSSGSGGSKPASILSR